MAHLEQSRLERAGEYERVQKKAFTNWVNSHLIKAGMKVTDINEDFKDGIKLLVLLELLTGEKLPRERGKMRVHKLQNVENALNFLKKVKKIKLVNIRNDEIVDGNPKLILGLLWTLILHFQLVCTLPRKKMVLRRELDDRPKHANMELYEMHEHARIQDSATQHEHVELDRLDDKTLGTDRQLGRDSDREISGGLTDSGDQVSSRPTSPQEISTKAIKEHLLQWAKMATDGYEGVNVENFHSSWRDGLAFSAILDRYQPDLLDFEECVSDEPLERLEKAFTVAEDLKIVRIVDPEDVNVQKPDEKAIMTYVSFLYQAFPEMPPPARRIRGPGISPADYSELYDNLKAWIDKTTDIAQNRDFPNSIDKLKKGIEKLEKIVSKDLPTRRQDVTNLSEMQDKIEAHQKKHPEADGVPADKDLAHLRNDWDTMEEELEKCQVALLEKLKRLEDLDALARKLNGECDVRTPAVDELEKRVGELEEKSSGMSSAEMGKAASDLAEEIQQQLEGVNGLQPGVDTLIEGEHPQAAAIQERVNSLKSLLESLAPRLEKVSSNVSEAEEMAAMENNLEELEAWLVSSGKFSSNQHILRQIQAHRAFQNDQLSKAEKDFTRIANSPPPPGMEEKVKEVNERFQRVVKQTEDRLAGLEPIVDEVLEFDELKNKLGNWCIAQQETIDQLPLLEVTEVKLLEQQQECHTLLDGINAQSESLQKLEEIATQFLRDTEPVQSIADQYARKLKAVKVRHPSEDHEEPSLGEQAGIIQSQFEWLKGCVTERDAQISSLLEKLHQFNLQYDDLQKFVQDGNELLAKEKPVGADAARVQEQMDTCQDFRAQITEKQPLVDAMLSLGREILAEPNTSSASDALMQKLTGFIQDWSDLQLDWQNWFDELHAGVEESKSLSDQLKKFESDVRGLGPALAKLFPASVSMKTLDKELQKLQGKFNSEVWGPYEAQKAVYETLQSSSSLLPPDSTADEIFKNFEDLSSTIESHNRELNDMIEEVGQWWAGCEGISQWLGDSEGRVIAHKPLASSLDILEQQKQEVQELVNGLEEHREDFEKSMKALELLSEHKQLLESAPVDTYKATLDRRWKALSKEMDSRKELSRCAKDHLSTYANDALPFAAWLKGVESRIAGMTTLPRTKDLLLLEKDDMKAFSDKVKVEGENLNQLEIKGSSFLGSAKTYQSQLLAYQRRVDPDRVASLPKDFVDLRTEDLTTSTVETDDFEGDRYQNGIRVVAGNSASLRRRYDALNAQVKQHQQVVEEAVTRRKDFDGCVQAFLDPLTELEAKCDGMVLSGESAPLKVEEKVETVRTLEVECLALEPKLQDAQAKYELLSDLCQEDEGVAWDGEDEALAEKEDAEKRHQYLLEKLRKQKEVLSDELSKYSKVFSRPSFLWLV